LFVGVLSFVTILNNNFSKKHYYFGGNEQTTQGLKDD
jgi:hypothetical protein